MIGRFCEYSSKRLGKNNRVISLSFSSVCPVVPIGQKLRKRTPWDSTLSKFDFLKVINPLDSLGGQNLEQDF